MVLTQYSFIIKTMANVRYFWLNATFLVTNVRFLSGGDYSFYCTQFLSSWSSDQKNVIHSKI